MFTFILVSNMNAERIFNNVYQALSTMGVPEKRPNGRLFVENVNGMKDGWIAFESCQSIQKDYEINNLEKIKKIIANPFFFLVEGRNGVVDFSDKFIIEFNPFINHTDKVLVDNDHGLIAGLLDIKERINLGKKWLYFSS